MHTTTKLSIAALVAALLMLTGCSAASPLRRSEASIRTSLLKRTPPGTTKERVESFMATQRWRWGPDFALDPRFHQQRAVDYAGGPPVRDDVVSMLQAEFGSYLTLPFFPRYVYGYWGFDTNDKLVDIWIYKETDAL